MPLQKGSLVLVTGATGFIASHTADQFLEAGYNVRGTVRDLDRAQWLYDVFDKKYGKGKFEAVVVKDMTEATAFDEAVKGVDGVVHLASIMTFSDKEEEVVPPTIKGAVNALSSALKESKIKSFVYTSSSTAALIPYPDKVINVTKDTWDDEAHEMVKNGNKTNYSDGFIVYAASKTEAERALWKKVNEEKPKFQVATVLPNANFGPPIKPGGESESSTGSWTVQLYNGNSEGIYSIPPQWFVDVRDTARLHVSALTDPSCDKQRIFAFAEPYNWTQVLEILQKQNPGKKFPDPPKNDGKDLSKIPNDDAEALLKKHYGKGWTSLEESIRDSTANLK